MNALTTPRDASKGMLVNLATRFDMDPAEFRQTIAHTVMPPETTEAEFVAFLMVCNTYTLNPILREIYAFPKKGGGIVPIVSVDGWIRIVNQHPEFKGAEWEAHLDDKQNLVAYTCRIYRNDRDMPIVVTEYLSECYRDTAPWKMKHRMLRHKAFIQCSRYAFGFSGIYDEDEGSVIADTRDQRAPAKPLAIPPTTGGGKDVFDGKGAVEDAVVTDVKQQDQSQPEQKTQEAKPAEAKAEPPKAKRKPNGWPALFQNARLVIEDGIFTKDVNDPESVGNQAEEADYADADLILTNGVITKQPGTVAKMTDAEIEQAMATVGTAFEHCDSMDALEVVKQSNKELYERLKAQDAHQPFIAIFRAAETRIKEADFRAEQEENEKAAKQQGDPVSSEERGEPVDDTFPGDRPSKAVETKSSADEMPVKNAIDPATLSPDLIPLLAMSSDDYTIYVRDYLAAFLAAKAEPVAVKRKFNSEDPVRTYIGMSDAARKELRRLRDEIVADLSGE